MEATVVVERAGALLRRAGVVRAPWCPDNLSFRMLDALVVAPAGLAPASARAAGAPGGPAGQLTSSAHAFQSSSTP
jgi:hypothetical protein